MPTTNPAQSAVLTHPPGPLELPYEPTKPSLRSTGMKTLHRCRRKFLWAERYGLRRGIDGEALRIGKYVHILLEQRYNGLNAGEAYVYAVDHVTSQREALQRDLRDGRLPSGERFEQVSKQMTMDLEKAYAAVDAFLAYYPLRKDQEVVATELHFKFRFVGFSQPIEGQIDLLIVDKEARQLTLVDIKTHSMSTLLRSATNVFDVQTHFFYTVGLQHLLSLPDDKKPEALRGFSRGDLTAVQYHLIRKPTIKCCKIDKYDVRNYIKRVRCWYDEETTKNPNNPPLANTRQPIHGDPFRDPEHLTRLRAHDTAAIHPAGDYAWFYKTANDTECAGIFGTCPFLDLCRTDKARSQWAPMLTQSFRQEHRT